MNEWTMSRIINSASGHFFSRDNMRFFSSRLSEEVFEGPGGIFFVTSERQDERHPRRYTVREFRPRNGSVHTTSEFQQFKTIRGAKNYAKRCADGSM